MLGRATKIILSAEWIRQIHRTGRVGNNDACTFGGERQCMRAPLTTGPSGDERDPTIQHTHESAA